MLTETDPQGVLATSVDTGIIQSRPRWRH